MEKFNSIFAKSVDAAKCRVRQAAANVPVCVLHYDI